MEHNSPPLHFDPDDPIEAFGEIPPYYSEFACPKCSSRSVEARNYATKAGCVIGAIAGVGVGVSLAGNLRGTRLGISMGSAAGPLGIALGGVAGAILDALASGAAGCATGITMGQIIDRALLNSHKCHNCGHTFSAH